MTDHPLLDRLRTEVLVSDGAMGTELQKRGLPPGACPEEFNISHPEVVQQIHREYFEACSQMVSTNSFGGNLFRLKEYGLDSHVKEFCRRAAELAKEVCPKECFVAGSIGPTGQILEPLGTTSLGEVRDAFMQQAEDLAEGGVDLFIVETMMAIEEAELAVRATREKGELPVAATMTFELGPKGFRTMWGVDIPTAVQRLTDAGADIVGSNCGRGFDDMVKIVQEMRPLTTKPILAQSNAGLPQWLDGKAVYPESPETIRSKVETILQVGANIIGGCCGTTPEHIRIIREVVNRFQSQKV